MMLKCTENESKKGSILIVTSNFPRWKGDSTTPFVLTLSQDIQACGWQVEVLAPHAPGAKREEILNGVLVKRFRYLWPERLETVCYMGGALINLRKHRLNFIKLPMLVFAELIAVTKALRKRKFDLVHSHWLLPQGFVCALCARFMGVPHVATIHGGDIFTLRGRMLRLFKQAALRLSDAVTVNSRATEDAVSAMGVSLPILARIPMGVETRHSIAVDAAGALRRKFRRNDGPLLIAIGRLVAEKGIGDVMAAVDALQPRLPDASLMILGEGQDKAMFQEDVRRRGLAQRVHFLGWVQHDCIHEYLAAADIFIGASRPSREGWIEAQGLTFLEAMSVGTPVIGTRLGGITDAIVDGKTGLLINAGALGELAEAIYRLHNEPRLREQMSSQAKLLVKQRFSREVSAERFSTLFQQLSMRRPHKKVKNISTTEK